MSFTSLKKDELVDLATRRFLFNDELPPLDSDEYSELIKKVKSDNTKDDLIEMLEQNNTRGFEVVAEEHRQFPYTTIKKPKHGSKLSVAYDIYLPVSINNFKHDNMVSTELSAYMQEGEGLFGVVRSSAGIKKGLNLSNNIMVIDPDYYNADNGGCMYIALNNLNSKSISLQQGTRVVQVWFSPYLPADNYDTNTKRISGIGSTNKGDE